MEPVSAAILSKTAETAIAETAREAGQEAVRETIENTLREAKQATEYANTPEFKQALSERMINDSYMRRAMESIPNTPEKALTRLQELKEDTNFKGRLGEILSETRDSRLGNVVEQVPVKNVEGFTEGSVIDHITTLEGPAKYKEMIVEHGETNLKDLYVKEGTQIATEVKNGGLNYLQNEIKEHLPKQITAGKEIADLSFVEINTDCYKDLIVNPFKASEIIQKINEHGGRLILGLPDYNSQLIRFREVQNICTS